MKYYPVCLDIKNRKCLVVGGGSVGTRKVKSLVDCGAKVKLVALTVSAELEKMAGEGTILMEKRPYAASDMADIFLVFGATSDMTVNNRISRDAEDRGVLCNIADFPQACNFILPSVVQRGDLQIAISTSGKSPAFARYLRKNLEGHFGSEYGDFLRLMGLVRDKLLAEEHSPEAHKPLFERLVSSGLPELIRNKQRSDVERVLSEILGEGFSSHDLGFDW